MSANRLVLVAALLILVASCSCSRKEEAPVEPQDQMGQNSPSGDSELAFRNGQRRYVPSFSKVKPIAI